MGNYTDLSGQRFGKLTAIKRVKDANGKYKWLCQCDCGNIKLVNAGHLRAGTTKSCGCSAIKDMQEKLTIDMTGKKFGKLTVIGQDSNWNGKGVHWLVKCECGNTKSFTGYYLRTWKPKSCGCESQKKYNRNELIELLKNYVDKNGYPINLTKDFSSKKDMPCFETYRDEFGGGLADWLKLCGYTLTQEEEYNLTHRGGQNSVSSKEECIKIIFDMQKHINRPLMYDDFRHPDSNSIGITQIRKYWGTMNNMKKELGLKVNQESMMDKKVTKEVLDCSIELICKKLADEGRNFVVTSEIDTYNFCATYCCLNRASRKYYGKEMSKILSERGVSIGECGRGTRYTFSDGENTTSMAEYLLSNSLRKMGIEYNSGYFRDVRYDSFIPDYKGNMNCDYVICIGDRKIYIEVAGVIGEYKKWYFENRKLNDSKTKEDYRIKLGNKEEMLKNEGLEYYILFPCDLTEENLNLIISSNNPKETRETIKKFNKTYVDWDKVKARGSLEYNNVSGIQV